MASHALFFFVLLGVALLSMEAHAVQYTVANNAGTTPGGIRFNNEIGIPYTQQILDASTNFIWRIFQQENSPGDRRNTEQVSLFIEDMDGVAYSSNDEIRFSARYLAGYGGDLKGEFTGVVYHEMTHSWQWNGAGQAPVGLVEGIADFVRLRAGYIPSYWVQPGQGSSWDEGYSVTAWFLDYCNGLRNGFVAELNKKMRTGYSNDFFVDLLGKSVDQLWTEYKAQYGQ